MARKDPKFFKEFEQTAANLSAEQATLLTATEKGLWDKWGDAITDLETVKEAHAKASSAGAGYAGAVGIIVGWVVGKVTGVDEEKFLKERLGGSYSEAELKQVRKMTDKIDAFKEKQDTFNERLAEFKRADDNSRTAELPVLMLENVVIRGTSVRDTQEHKVDELIAKVALSPSTIGDSEIYVLSNQVSVSSTAGAEANSRNMKILKRGDKLNNANNEIPPLVA
jgi:hypothetical protein